MEALLWILLWIMMAGIYALCIWMWMSQFGWQFPRLWRRSRRMRAELVSPSRLQRCLRNVQLLGTLLVVGTASLGCTISECAVGGWPHLWPSGSASATTLSPNRQAESMCLYQPGARGPRPAAVQDAEFTFTHPRVERLVARFQTAGHDSLSNALSRSGRYVPRMSKILRQRGLPQELAYLPLIESGFRPHAVSPAGAVGPWQFLADTGRRYGLRIDRYVDERRDPVKSTHAAARYLKELHATFGSWHLALAAYNTGEQNIARILQTSEAADFWEMRRRGYLCAETADFVPQFLAALHIAETPTAFGFEAPREQPWQYEVVTVARPLSLAAVARLSGATTRTIKELNPALQRGTVPPHGYAVRLPRGTRATFQLAYASLGLPEHRQPRRTRAIRMKAVAEAQCSTPAPAQRRMSATL